jgi:hypothetical protein
MNGEFEYVYVLVCNGGDWEDMKIVMTKEQAIEMSIKYSKSVVEVFRINEKKEYIPIYQYYKNGELYKEN